MLQSKVNGSCSLTSGSQGCEHLHQKSASSVPGNISGPVPGSWEWFYIFRWLEKKSREESKFCDKWKWYEIQISASRNKVLLEHCPARCLTRCPRHVYHHSRAEKLWQATETVWPHGTFFYYLALCRKNVLTPGLEWGDVTSAQGHHEGSDTSPLLS